MTARRGGTQELRGGSLLQTGKVSTDLEALQMLRSNRRDSIAYLEGEVESLIGFARLDADLVYEYLDGQQAGDV